MRPGMSGRPDPKLIKLLVRAHRLKEKLRSSPGIRVADLAMREKLSPSYVALLLRLTFLAPDITRAILEGRQPGGFTAQKLVTYSGLPLGWPEQRQALGCVRAGAENDAAPPHEGRISFATPLHHWPRETMRRFRRPQPS